MIASYASYRQAAAARLTATLSLTPSDACREVDFLARTVLEATYDLTTHAHTTLLDTSQRSRLDALLNARVSGTPLAHVLGDQTFYGLSLRCSPAVLVPRPDTELLVDCVLATLAKDTNITIADFGCGSGAIAAALAQHLPNARLLAVERDADAAAVAQANFTALALTARIELITADWLTVTTAIDLVVCNPPYVTTGMCMRLREQGLLHDPLGALDGGDDGLVAYRSLFTHVATQLPACQDLLCEHGIGQHHALSLLAVQHGLPLADYRRDLQGIKRVLHLRRDA